MFFASNIDTIHNKNIPHMAAAPGRSRCIACDKEKATMKCGGCLQDFCYNHLADHRQELSKQLDEIEVTRDLFRQLLTEKISDPHDHTLIQQIDKWENDSMNKIRQAAEEARQILLKHTAGINTEIEGKLNKLTDQLRQSRQDNDFFETDLNQWQEELNRMKNDLTKPSNVTFRQDSTPLITKINIDISNQRNHIKSNTKTDGIERLSSASRYDRESLHQSQATVISCSFCEEEFSSPKAMGEHLMSCGNKTDQCPNCRQFVRRAIRAYHSENDCTDPDAPMVDDELDQRTRHSNRSRHFKDSRAIETICCEYCDEPIEFPDYEKHIKACRMQTRGEMEMMSQYLSPPTINQCKFCGRQMSINALAFHQALCKMNPNRSGRS